jgi:pyruvate/2-oxoglutarate dehydrogenase complex dihydrolipoamide dehydrogenase (E3) component
MAGVETFDAIVLGAGQAGNVFIQQFATTGKKIALVEKSAVGGACANVACLPSKNYLHKAELAHSTQVANQTWLPSSAKSQVDLSQVRAQKRHMVSMLQTFQTGNLQKAGVTIMMGTACFLDSKRIEVREQDTIRVISAEVIVVNVGTRAKIPDIPGLRKASPLTHVEALELDEVPNHLIILGAGYVGLEFAQAMTRFGAKVSVIDKHAEVLAKEDEDMASALREILSSEGVQFYLPADVEHISGFSGHEVEVFMKHSGASVSVKGSHILCAMGREPNTTDMGLEAAGVKVDARGYIVVDEYLRTSVNNIFAVGECAGSPQFTHVSVDDGRVISGQIMKTGSASTLGRLIPSTLFTSPELAHVGMRENELKANEIDYRLGKIPAMAIPRNITAGTVQGVLKVMVAAGDDSILGFTALCDSAGEVLFPLQLAMKHGLPYTDFTTTMACHPTRSEGLVSLMSAVPPRSHD